MSRILVGGTRYSLKGTEWEYVLCQIDNKWLLINLGTGNPWKSSGESTLLDIEEGIFIEQRPRLYRKISIPIYPHGPDKIIVEILGVLDPNEKCEVKFIPIRDSDFGRYELTFDPPQHPSAFREYERVISVMETVEDTLE